MKFYMKKLLHYTQSGTASGMPESASTLRAGELSFITLAATSRSGSGSSRPHVGQLFAVPGRGIRETSVRPPNQRQLCFVAGIKFVMAASWASIWGNRGKWTGEVQVEMRASCR
jgi:hypothetical protein